MSASASSSSRIVVECGQAGSTIGKPDFDSIAASLSALSVAIAIGSVLIGLLAVIVTVVWNRSTKLEAVTAARDEARNEAARQSVDFMQTQGLKKIEDITRDHLTANRIADTTIAAGGLS